MSNPIHTQTNLRRAMGTMDDWLWFFLILALLLAILLPSLSRARELAKRTVCGSNQSGIGQAFFIYANDNVEWFPHHFYSPAYGGTDDAPEHGVQWVGSMATTDGLSIKQKTSKETSPTRSHPSRSLFLLVMHGQVVIDQFICPSSGDFVDPLRNYGADAVTENESAAQPGRNRFDFRGYDSLSYGYQLPYGRHGKPHLNLDVRMAIVADKGPYYANGGEGVLGTRTTVDKRSTVGPPSEWRAGGVKAILQRSNDDWRKYNSQLHRGEGQTVLFVDGHAEFTRRPIFGVMNDNLYTIQDSPSDAAATLIGMVPDATQTRGPLTNTDSFIVP